MKTALTLFFTGCLWISFLTLACADDDKESLDAVKTLVVMVLENHSFDNLYGLFPGADGIENARLEQKVQVDAEGRPYPFLPTVMDTRTSPPSPDQRFPQHLPNGPFPVDAYVGPEGIVADPTHRFYQTQEQINGGRMNRFAGVSSAGGLVMGYYDGHQLPLWRYAQRYRLLDHFFAGAFGGSFINHVWLACGCVLHQKKVPENLVIRLGPKGEVVKEGAFTEDGYAVNNVLPANGPHGKKDLKSPLLLEPQDLPTIGDRLSQKGVDWAWYSGGWLDALAGEHDPSFRFHHQPFAYFKAYAPGMPARRQHIRDESDFINAIHSGTLPPVSFFKPLGKENEHPADTDILTGENKMARLLAALEKSPQWPGMVVIVIYDEFGGYWDHVAPPKGDRWGPGVRVPALIVSPFTRGKGLDHRTYETSSILKLIEHRFDLAPLGPRDAKAPDLADALELD